ncbi:MAG: TonB-dependent receptor plug domain-containing protein [Pseudomonadota bacterium]|nr:TonB-dependent receptor plug domain-containing protein [Pseudomonadota bacterium]
MNTKPEYRVAKRAFSPSALANVVACSAFTLTLCSTSLAAADSARLEEVVVSGVADPRMGSLLTSTEIRTTSAGEQITLPLSIGSLADALPGVSLNGQGGLFQSYSMRGFSRWRIRTEISGVPILTDRRAGNSLSFLPPELIDSIQVNMGPASSLYGSGAMGGVMNVSLLNPTQTSLSVSASSMGNAREVSLKTPINASTSLLGSIREASNGKSGDGTPLNTSFEQSTFYVRNKSYVNDTEVSTEVLVSDGNDIGKSSALFPNTRVTHYPHDNHRLLNFRATTPNNWFFQTYAHQQDWASMTLRDSGLENTSDYSSMTIGGLLSRTSQSEQSTQRYGLDVTRRYGVDITETTAEPEAEIASRNVINDGTEWTAGLFWERSWYLNGLSLQGGFRADRAEAQAASIATRHSNINLQLKANWQLTSVWDLTIELGSAYRLPTLSELYFEGETPRGRLLGNNALQSEETVGAQLTLLYDVGDTAFEMTASANRVDRYIERILLSDSLESYRNLKSGDLWGIDGQIQRRNNNVEHILSWQWQHGESSTGETIADLPPPSIRYATSWRRSSYALGMDLRYRFSRNRSGPGELALASAAIFGVSAEWMINPEWTVKTSVTNGLNKTYRTSATLQAPFDMGRAINVKVDWRP